MRGGGNKCIGAMAWVVDQVIVRWYHLPRSVCFLAVFILGVAGGGVACVSGWGEGEQQPFRNLPYIPTTRPSFIYE